MKEAEERDFRDLPEGQAWVAATRDDNVAVWEGVQRHLKQSRTHFRPNPNPLSHLSLHLNTKDLCVSLSDTLWNSSLHSSQFQHIPLHPREHLQVARQWSSSLSVLRQTSCPHHVLSSEAEMFSC